MDIRSLMVEDHPTREKPASHGIIFTMPGTDYLFAPRPVPCR
ncbi:MAG: hypothetical protein R3311_12105 [Oceanisphaera sp.]|nr:hypothetical protein [Oceanisphaera sp.]